MSEIIKIEAKCMSSLQKFVLKLCLVIDHEIGDKIDTLCIKESYSHGENRWEIPQTEEKGYECRGGNA